MFTVTFYSYKGGVGRTLALANVAYTLATEGGKQRVVVVDFDLEAPGIDTIAPFDSAKGTEKGGIVEYIAEYAKGSLSGSQISVGLMFSGAFTVQKP